jgi:hypothetical protein
VEAKDGAVITSVYLFPLIVVSLSHRPSFTSLLCEPPRPCRILHLHEELDRLRPAAMSQSVLAATTIARSSLTVFLYRSLDVHRAHLMSCDRCSKRRRSQFEQEFGSEADFVSWTLGFRLRLFVLEDGILASAFDGSDFMMPPAR